MEKLKQAKHNHLLTDWLKVGIFALLLLLPFFIFAPTAFYYGFNEHATAPTKQVENTTTIHMQQYVINGLPNSLDHWIYENVSYSNTNGFVFDIGFDDCYIYQEINLNLNANDIVLTKISGLCSVGEGTEYNFSFNPYTDNGDDYEKEYNLTNDIQTFNDLFTITQDATILYFNIYMNKSIDLAYLKYLQVFNLTQMFGSGNEPTIEEFNTLFPNDYYAYDSDATAEWQNGTYTTYTDISSTMSFAWESMFDTQLLKWTKDSPFKTSINGFLTLFQIPQQSGIGLYLNYLITMVCIYVVFDIVIQLFKWLTHIIGEK